MRCWPTAERHAAAGAQVPARVVVYLLLAAALFDPGGYPAVWGKLTGALQAAGVPAVTPAALWQARTRLVPAPLRALFDLLRGSIAAPRTSGAGWRGLLVCAIDGTTLDVPDTPGHRARLGHLVGQRTSTCDSLRQDAVHGRLVLLRPSIDRFGRCGAVLSAPTRLTKAD